MHSKLRTWLITALMASLAFVCAGGLAHAQSIICAQVKLEIAQQAALEREAFDAKLGIINNFPEYGLLNFRTDIVITDEQGNPANDKFFITLSTMTGINAVDGTGVVQPSGTADVHWLIIPSTGAGGTNALGIKYFAKANLSYMLNGVLQQYSTINDDITVKPQPLLNLEYFLPFEITADEPLTETVEVVEPFALGLRVINGGYGTAKNLKINSGQPKIVENKQGLLIGFQLLNTWLGANVLPANTLNIPFGDITPGTAKTAQWRMSSTLSGRFTEFTASFTHSAELGGALTSLIGGVTTYTLVRDILVDLPNRDSQFDFLVNVSTPRSNLEDMFQNNVEVLPDYIMESDQLQSIPVYPTAASISGTLSGSHSALTLALTGSVVPNTWVYASIPAPQNGAIPLLSVTRADGKVLNAKNFWISRHYNKQSQTFTNRLHLIDLAPATAQAYTLNFDTSKFDIPPSPVENLAALPSQPGLLALNWTSVGEDNNSGTIYNGKYAIYYSTDLAATPSLNSANVVFSTTTNPALAQVYALNGLLGNATYQFALWTADSQMHYSSASNMATALTYAYAPNGLAVVQTQDSSLTVSWSTAANTSGTEYSARLLTAPGGNLLSSSGFQAGLVSYSFGQLAPNTSYYASAQARDAQLRETAFSSDLVAVTLARKPELATTSVLEVSSSSVKLTWLDAGNPSDTRYQLQYSQSADFSGASGSVHVSTQIAQIAGLASNTTYYFRVAALNRNGVLSDYLALSSTITFSAPPVITGIVSGTDSFAITWSTVSTAGYLVEAATNNFSGGDLAASAYVSGAEANSHTLAGLSHNGVYSVRVSAVNHAGQVSASPATAAYTLALPPTGLQVAVSSTSASMAWTGAEGEGYNVQASAAPEFATLASSVSVPAGTLNAQFYGLAPNNRYYYRVGNANRGGIYNYSAALSSATLAAIPTAPEFAEVNASSATARWNANGNPSGTAYHAELSSAQDFSVLSASADVAGLAANFGGLAYESTYYFRVAARNMDGIQTDYSAAIATATLPDMGTQPYISEVTPSSGSIGIPFTVNGVRFGTYNGANTRVLIGGTTAPISVWNDTQIKGTIPGLVADGDLSVVVERIVGGVVSRSQAKIFTLVPPTATEITPSSGPIGIPYTLTGHEFGNYNGSYTRVLIGGATTLVTLWTDTKIQGTIPGNIQAGQLELFVERATADGGLRRSATIYFSATVPSIESVTPSTAAIGVPFTITGTNFGNYNGSYTRVLIGGTTAPITAWSDTQIKGSIPGITEDGEKALVVERATADGGLMASATFVFTLVPPMATEIIPSTGPIGIPYTLNGQYFGNYNGSSTNVLVNGATTQISSWTDTKIQGTIPGAEPGAQTVVVERKTSDGGLRHSAPIYFTVAAMAMDSVAPSSGPIGIPFTVTGNNFGNYNGNNTRLMLGISTVTVSAWSNTTIQGVVPGMASGEYPLAIERVASDGTLMRSATMPFIITTPAIASMTPATGPIGIAYTLNGTSFGQYNGTNTQVLIGGTTTPITLWNDSVIQGTVPGVSGGPQPVIVQRRTADGGLVESSSFTYTVQGLAISSVLPSSGPIGVPFTITGNDFGAYNGSNTRVKFGDMLAPITLWNNTTIQGTIPGVASGTLELAVERVSTDGGLMRTTTGYLVTTPEITGMSPASGPIGIAYTLNGASFGQYNGTNTQVLIGGATTSITLWNDNKIQGTIPGTIATGAQPVIVRRKTVDGGMVESSSATYTVSGIEISSVTPPSGPIGIAFTINGANFGTYNGTNTKVKFCGLTAPITSWTDALIKGTIPGAPAGDCELAIERITADGGLMRGTTVFAIAGPVITSMSTSTAPIGLPITLNGANFGTYNGSYTRVKINGVVMPVTSWIDTKIQGTVPGIAQPGNYPLVVERATADGGLSQSTATTFGVVAPQLTTMSPTSLRIGTVAYTLNGSGFGNYNGANTVVLIGGTTTAVSVWTDTQIKGTTPGSLQTGTHQVIVRRVAQGVASDSNALTLELVLPVISAIDPTTGVAGTGFTITGTGFGPYDSTVVGGYPSTRVKVGTMVASLSEWTDTQIRGIIPDTLGPGIHSVTVQRVTSAGSAVSNTVTFAIDGGSGSSGRSARGLSNFMPVRGKATVSGYPTKLVEAGLPLLKEHGGRPESWNRTSIKIEPDGLPEDTFVTIALNKGEESSLEELEAALVPSKVAAAGPSTVFGPLSAKAKSPMVIELPYSASAIPDGKSELDLAIHKWNKHTSLWESIPTELDTRNKRLRATVNEFGTYQAMAQGVLYADATFKLGEIYSFPNPAKGGHKPTLHIEVGVADYVKVRIYDVSGDLRHSVQIDAAPVILDDGTGAAYAYEYAWNASGVGSGVYIYVIEAHKGDETIRATRKLTYIR